MTRRLSLLVGTAAVIALLGAGCAKSTNTNTNTNTTTDTVNTDSSTLTTQSVAIKSMAYAPGTLTVKKGTKVTWTNQDSAPHTVTGDNGGPASGNLGLGDTYSFTFNTAGTFPYHCAVHGFTGTITVTN